MSLSDEPGEFAIAIVSALRERDAEIARLRASLAEAVGEIRITAAFLEGFQRADLDEPISDGGHTAGPLFQQQARRYLRAARDFITKYGGGS
jgi:hypothetical protein